jgi:hypothetical protein
MKHDIQMQAVQTVQAVQTPVPAPAAAPSTPPTPVAAPQAYSANLPLPLPPRAESAIDLRPAQIPAMADDASVRALPVALPVGISPSDVR